MATTAVTMSVCSTCDLRFMALSRATSFREIGRDAVGTLRGHDDRLPAFGELRMAEHELVRSDGDEQISDRRLADLRAVEQNLRPRPRVDADRDARRIETNRGGLPRRHLDAPR